MKAQMLGVQGKLPVWLVAGLILVGFDDAVWMLRNPLLLTVAIILSIVVYVAYVLNLHILLKERTKRDMDSVLRRTKRLLDQMVTENPQQPTNG